MKSIKEKATDFIGKQIGRMFLGQKYFAAFYQISVILLFVSVLLHIPNDIILLLFLFGVSFVWFIGYFVDKTELAQKELKKTIMQQKEGSKQLNKSLWKELTREQNKEFWEEIVMPLLDTLINNAIKKLKEK